MFIINSFTSLCDYNYKNQDLNTHWNCSSLTVNPSFFVSVRKSWYLSFQPRPLRTDVVECFLSDCGRPLAVVVGVVVAVVVVVVVVPLTFATELDRFAPDVGSIVIVYPDRHLRRELRLRDSPVLLFWIDVHSSVKSNKNTMWLSRRTGSVVR